MKMDIGEVFCELVSGLALMSLLLPLLDILGKSSLSQSLQFIGRNINATKFAGTLVLAYSFGLMMDSFGIPFSDWLVQNVPKLKKWTENKPRLKKWTQWDTHTTQEQRAIFYIKVSAHVLQHREYEYAYLVAYTNLFIIALLAGCFWGITGLKYGWSRTVWLVFSLVFICSIFALWKSIKSHGEQDAEITKAYGKDGADE